VSDKLSINAARPALAMPNPSRGNFKVDVSEAFVGGSAVVIDMNGREVHRISKLEKVQDVRLKNLPNGIYSMFLTNDEETDQVTLQIER